MKQIFLEVIKNIIILMMFQYLIMFFILMKFFKFVLLRFHFFNFLILDIIVKMFLKNK